MRMFYSLLWIALASSLFGVEEAWDAVPNEAEVEAVAELAPPLVEFMNQSWFTDRVGRAQIHFESLVEVPETFPRNEAIHFIEMEVLVTPDSEKGKCVANLLFILRESGLITFPSLEFVGEVGRYRTLPQQILVGEPQRAETMELRLSPSKQRVYVGEPLRVDFYWQSDLDAGRLQALNYYPDFFSDSAVEIVIPRNVEADHRQVGLPIGGRRVIAKRTVDPEAPSALGTVELPLYLRFQEEGVYELPATRLECAYTAELNGNITQYAAHFNNGLFAPEDATERYKRFYVETEPIEIEVLRLPEDGQDADFSGLFGKPEIEVTVSPEVLTVGQLMEVEMKVFSEAPHGMIELPLLSRQRGLRGRFLVDDALARFWRVDGTTFRARVRALSADVAAFPTLRIQSFDTRNGGYIEVSSKPVPLKVRPSEGQGFVGVDTYSGARISLVGQPDGIWHNLEANLMDDLLNQLVALLASGFWLFMFLGPAAFVLLLPWVRERRRRATDPKYQARMEAFAAFKRLPEADPAKWDAFLSFLAVSFHSSQQAWTVDDSRRALRSIELGSEDIEAVVRWHQSVDAEQFHPEHPSALVSELNAIGMRVLKQIGKSALLLLFCGCVFPTDLVASDFSGAEALFEQAVVAPVGSDAALALYAESALKFQAAAEAGGRSGVAWYNAGNAWFQTGALGRSIVAYREAQLYRPFDPLLRDNLLAARSLTLSDVPTEGSQWLVWPTAWLKALLVVLSLIFWGLLLCFVRFRRRLLLATIVLCLLALLGVLALLAKAEFASGKQGVVIADEVFARKGPSYSYAKAFLEPLQDGLEFTLQETRGEWGLIALADGRECWVTLGQIQLIRH